MRIRVEGIAANLDLKVRLKPLRHAIRKLHKASLRLDKEKHEAEKHLRHVIKEWQRRHHHHAGNKNHHPYSHHCGSRWKRVSTWVKTVFGATSRDVRELDGDNRPETVSQHEPSPAPSDSYDHPYQPHHPPHKLIKAVKRVQAVNHKLSCFESGFVSKEGLAGREWYKHLGVAPGKWLG